MSTAMSPREPIRCLIVDDEPLAREGIRLRLEEAAGFRVAGECATVDEGLAHVAADPPDVLFLDVRMPGKDGFELLQEAGLDAVPVVVFVTAYDEHALEAFRVRALDYLVKPFDDDRFAETLARIRERLAEVRDGELGREVRRVVSGVGPGPPPARARSDRIPVRTGEKVLFVAIDDIDWIEAARDYVVLHVGAERHVIRSTLRAVLEELTGRGFARIHRSGIVNVARIRELRPLFHGDYVVVLHNGLRLKCSRTYRDELAAVLRADL